MTTFEIAEALAKAASGFPILGKITARDLLETVRLELGHLEALDGFHEYGGHLAMAKGPVAILHILSGNTPHGALQSLIRGMLLQSHNLMKIPSTGLPEVEGFKNLLPESLARHIEISRELPESWIRDCDACVVFGSDETIAHFRARVPHGKIFQAHGHRVSFAVVFEDPDMDSVCYAAGDVSLFDQKGCLSPHCFYVRGNARAYAQKLAEEMESYNKHTPRGMISTSEAAAIVDIRASYQFRSANDHRVQIWQSSSGTDWTVIYEDDAWFASSCLNRVVFVKPLPDDLISAVLPISPWIGAIGIWPVHAENAKTLLPLLPSRICPIGQMQYPPFSWHQEGRQTLAPLVRWVDLEA